MTQASNLSEFPIEVDARTSVSGLLIRPSNPRACLVFAHGAGAGMRHASMATVAEELGALGVATLRYQFPYMEKGSKRPDAPSVCHATVRAAVAEARKQLPGIALIAGGRSFGGRMTSQAQALASLPEVRGLAFFAFPLHPAKKPAAERAEHLLDIRIPMLFLQGTRDELASLDLLQALIKQLGPIATLHLAQDADHSFHVPAKTGRKDAHVRHELLEAFVAWLAAIGID